MTEIDVLFPLKALDLVSSLPYIHNYSASRLCCNIWYKVVLFLTWENTLHYYWA